MYGADRQFFTSPGDAATDFEAGLAIVVADHLGVLPFESRRCAESFRQSFLDSEAGSLGSNGAFALSWRQHAFSQGRSAFQRFGEPSDVGNIDSHAYDHIA